jgi:hypothetical protein
MVVAPSSAHMSPHINPLPILASSSTSTLPVNNWRDALVVDDFGGESNSAWDVQFSGEEVVSQYTTSLDQENIRNLGFEQSLEAARTYSLWAASIATDQQSYQGGAFSLSLLNYGIEELFVSS